MGPSLDLRGEQAHIESFHDEWLDKLLNENSFARIAKHRLCLMTGDANMAD